jgi:hypothetical protein
VPGREGSESAEEWAISVLNGGCVGDEASLYGGRRRSNFTGQAQRCRALVSGLGAALLAGCPGFQTTEKTMVGCL